MTSGVVNGCCGVFMMVLALCGMWGAGHRSFVWGVVIGLPIILTLIFLVPVKRTEPGKNTGGPE